MPIKIKCQCGKALSVKDQFAGKKVKCPECGSAIQVPGGQASNPAVAASPAATPGAQPVGASAIGNPMNDLFDEEGFGNNIAAICPNCHAEMSAEAVLCTSCGFNKTTGESLKGHRTVGVDISAGTMALEKAADDMARADKLQKDMTERAGMPWWILALILFIIGSASVLAVMAVMATTQVEENGGFNPMRLFLQLSGTACSAVAIGAFGKLVLAGFKEERNVGLLCLTVLYLPVFVFKKPKGRVGPFLVLLIIGGAAGFLLFRASQV